MAFGSQNGNSNGGFGSKGGGFFGDTNNSGGFGFGSNTGFGQNTTPQTNTGFGQNTTQQTNTGFGQNTTQQNNTGANGNTTGNNFGTSTVSNPPVSNKTSSATSRVKLSSLTCIRGKVSQYRTCSEKSGNYRRLLPRKIYQAIVYGQRFEDFLHSFTLTETKGVDNAGNPITQRYVVNVHGSTNFGATLMDNEEVEVKGKFTADNIFMASEVSVINGNVATPIKFQRSVKLTTLFVLVVVGLMLLMCGLMSGGNNSMSAGMNVIWGFITTMFAVYVVLLILYVVSSFTRIGFMTRMLSGGRRGSSPLLTMLIIAFIITLMLYNVFGIGTAVGNLLAGALDVFGPIIVMIVGVVILLKVFK